MWLQLANNLYLTKYKYGSCAKHAFMLCATRDAPNRIHPHSSNVPTGDGLYRNRCSGHSVRPTTHQQLPRFAKTKTTTKSHIFPIARRNLLNNKQPTIPTRATNKPNTTKIILQPNMLAIFSGEQK